MRLALVHTRAATLELIRYPAFSVPTLVFPALFFPFSKTLFIAVDLTFRPNEPEDYEEPREVTPHSSRGRRT